MVTIVTIGDDCDDRFSTVRRRILLASNNKKVEACGSYAKIH